jgi:hypothetical protein
MNNDGKIKGAMPPEVRAKMSRWLDQCADNFQRGFTNTAVSCAENAKRVFNCWYREQIKDRQPK